MAKTPNKNAGPDLERRRPGKDEVLFVPLGGAGEIGMNMYMYGHDGRWLLVDMGIGFTDETMLGADILVPDPTFAADRADLIEGLVLTHAHEDHIGAIQYLWEDVTFPIYATPFTAAVLTRKLKESGLGNFGDIHVVQQGERFSVGQFDLELVTMTHSVPEPNALIIRTGAGNVLHTGDWKLDPTPPIGPEADEPALRRLGEEGLMALICDSTNVLSPGESGSEQAVREGLTSIVSQLRQKVAVTCFSTNVTRIESIAHAAAENDRHVALVGRALKRITDAAKATGYLKDTPAFLSEEEAGYLPDDKVVYICTGSQGERRSALARIAQGDHQSVSLGEGDAVIFSSRVIPGNEHAIGRMRDNLLRRGVQVITDDDAPVHVSGHPSREEMIRLYQWVRPRISVPIHGEYRHLRAHAALAAECQVPSAVIPHNGAMIRLAAEGGELLGDVFTGALAVDEDNLLPIDGEAMRQRRRLLFNGAVFVTLHLDRRNRLKGRPSLSILGFDEDEIGETEEELGLIDDVEQAILTLLDTADEPGNQALFEATRRAVRRPIKSNLGKRPEVVVHTVRD